MNWFFKQGCRNPVFINLLSVIVIVLGIFSSIQLKRELFPPMNMDTVRVTLAMDNSSTAENIDENIIRIVYPYLQGIEGVKQIRSVATKSSGIFYLDIYNKANIDKVKQKVKDAIDRINDLPKGVEKPIVETIKHHENAIDIAVYGEGFSHIKLKTFLQEIKSDIISKKIASLITFKPERKIELRITLPSHTLQSKGLTIEDVGKQLKAYTIDATAGKIRGDNSFMVLESDARKLSSDDFEEIPIQFPNGEFIPLKHLGTVEKDFKEDEAFVNFNGDPAAILSINKAENEDITEISIGVREYLNSLELPSGLHATAFNDTSKYVQERLWLITKNALSGLILVLIVLSLFLEWRVAFWAASGIAFSLLGAFAILYFLDNSINVLSLFGFLMASGIVVDDAIVVGEEFFRQHDKGQNGIESGSKALKIVSKPVIAMMLTSLLAFIPLLFIEGMMGKFISVIPVVVIATLALSLLESLFILPVHLAHHVDAKKKSPYHLIEKLLKPYLLLTKKAHRSIDKGMLYFKDKILVSTLKWSLTNRYALLIFYLALSVLLFGAIPAGWIKLSLFPNVDSDFYQAKIKFTEGVTTSHTKKATELLITSLKETAKEVEKREGVNPLLQYHTLIDANESHEGGVYIQLISSEDGRTLSGQAFIEEWRAMTPTFPDVKTIEYSSYKGGMPHYPILIELSSSNSTDLEKAEKLAKEYLKTLDGVVDISSNEEKGALIANIKLKDTTNSLSLSEQDISTQLTHLLDGYKVDTFVEDEEEIDVYVRASPEDRQDLYQIENHILSNGLHVKQIADISQQREAAKIERQEGLRLIKVNAYLTRSALPMARELRSQIERELFPEIKKNYPFMKLSLGGEAKDGNEAFQSILRSYLPALFAIYLILATLFRSYIQPFIIMLAIPFCFIGAMIGHFFMGLSLNLMSLFGIIALTGIAINDSLVLIDCINNELKKGTPLKEALIKGGKRRFRPIFLTSISTIACLGPVLLESSFQAQFLIPMVTSLVFGLAFSTFFILLLIPIGFHIASDGMNALRALLYGSSTSNDS